MRLFKIYLTKIFIKFDFLKIEIQILSLILLAQLYNTYSISNLKRIRKLERFLDQSCKNISSSLVKHIKFNKINHNHCKHLILITRIQKGGGLINIYNKILKNNSSFSLITNIFKYKINTNSISKFDSKKHLSLYEIGCINRIQTIINYILNNNVSTISIINDDFDPLPYISFLLTRSKSRKYNFYHHATHSFTFGMFEKDWHHIDLFQNQHHLCKKDVNSNFISMVNFL